MPMNFAKTGLLLAVLTGIFVAMGGLFGGTGAAWSSPSSSPLA